MTHVNKPHPQHLGTLVGSLMVAGLACAVGEIPSDNGFGSPQTAGIEVEPMMDDEAGAACVPGAQTACACPGGGEGVQVCESDGASLGACECEGSEGDAGGDDAEDGCGDLICDADEDCSSCPMDCGVCEPCTVAPACATALVPPAIDVNAEFLNDWMSAVTVDERRERIAAHIEGGQDTARLLAAALAGPTSGEASVVTTLRAIFQNNPGGTAAIRRQVAAAGMPDPEQYRMLHPIALGAARVDPTAPSALASGRTTGAPCDDPRMRIRVAQITVHEEDDDFANDEVYCLLTSEAGTGAEVKVTPMTPALDEGDVHTFNLDSGLLWGQADLVAPMGNILLQYDCIESDTSTGYTDLLAAVADAADQAAGINVPGVDGWVFPTLAALADLLASALSLDNDDQLFSAQQVVPEAEMINLTTGAWWFVRRQGTNLNSDWDWELRMEIWGCHDNAD